jgi:hypothetical protein
MSFQHRHFNIVTQPRSAKVTNKPKATERQEAKATNKPKATGAKKRSIADVACLNIEVEVCLESVGLP